MGPVRLLSALLRALVPAAIVGGGLAYAAVPGPHRALTPDAFGIPQVSDRLYIDAPEAAGRVEAMIDAADAAVAEFFGPPESAPVFVVCTGAACAETLALKANGMTYAAHLIIIGPGGVNQHVITHERVHAELHRSIGPADLLGPRFPAWFDEGLAAHLSGETRLRRPADPRQADWILAAENWFAWRRLREGRDWRESYGAAAALVAEVEQVAGRVGLIALIEAVEAGDADFGAAYARALGR